MPQVSKKLLARKIEIRMFTVLEKAVADLKSGDDIKNFLDDLLTSTEKVMLAKRLAIAVLLAKDYNYRQICDVLKLSSNTVTSVLKHQVINGRGYAAVVKKILRDESSTEFFLNLEKTISKLISHPARHGSIESRYFLKKKILEDEII